MACANCGHHKKLHNVNPALFAALEMVGASGCIAINTFADKRYKARVRYRATTQKDMLVGSELKKVPKRVNINRQRSIGICGCESYKEVERVRRNRASDKGSRKSSKRKAIAKKGI